jgi:hypothetical protein
VQLSKSIDNSHHSHIKGVIKPAKKTHNNKKLLEYSMRDGFSSASYLNKYYSAAALHERKSLGSLSSALHYKNSRRECEGYKQLNREPRFSELFFSRLQRRV